MALPAGVTGKTVTTGPWTLPDGSIATGRATIVSSVNLIHTPTGQPLPSGSMSQRLVDGSASWVLVPTDQAGLNRLDATYTLSVEINGAFTQPDPITFLLPSAGPDTVDLDPFASVPSSAGTPVAPITVTSVNGKTGAVALTAADVGADAAGAATTAQAAAILYASTGLAGKQDAATLGSAVAADPTVRAAFDATGAATAAQAAAQAYADTKTAAEVTRANAAYDAAGAASTAQAAAQTFATTAIATQATADRAAFVAGHVYNSDGSLNTAKTLHVVLTADGADIQDLIIQ